LFIAVVALIGLLAAGQRGFARQIDPVGFSISGAQIVATDADVKSKADTQAINNKIATDGNMAQYFADDSGDSHESLFVELEKAGSTEIAPASLTISAGHLDLGSLTQIDVALIDDAATSTLAINFASAPQGLLGQISPTILAAGMGPQAFGLGLLAAIAVGMLVRRPVKD
jgi:hypothetical protein